MPKIALIFFVLMFSCDGDRSSESIENDLTAFGGKGSISAMIDHARTMADDTFLAKNIGRDLTIKIGRGEAIKTVSRDVLKKELVQITLKNKGIAPDHLHRVMRFLVDDDSTLCGGASCSRVFGFRKKDVSRLMDDTAKAVKKSESLADPSEDTRRSQILESLLPTINQKLRESLSRVFPSRSGTRSAGLQKITISQVESLTDSVMNARMGLIRRMILEQKDLDDSEIVRMVLDPIRAIFFLAQESTDGQRAAIREEIRQLGFRSVEFNPMDMRESIDMFMEDFSRSGAMYIQAGSHAKAVVAYNPKTRTFYLRDSANSRRQDYSHVDWDEFFNNLTYYGTVYQKPDFSP